MAHEMLQAIVGMAIVDADFRCSLLEKPSRVLADFQLTTDEAAAVVAIEANSFQSFASQLHNWISKDTVRARAQA